MGLCGYFCEWANEIKTRKFVPQQSSRTFILNLAT